MDTPITFNGILVVLGIIVAIVAGITAIIMIVKWITGLHDKVQKWDGYEKTMENCQTDIDAKLQQLQAEQCMLTYCMMAVLDGLHQQGCNGKVTEAREKLDKYLNKTVHGVE